MATGLRIDDSKRIAGMLNLLKSGKDLFDSAPSYDEKKRGLVKCVEGMKELKIVIEDLSEREAETKYNKARRSMKRARVEFQVELEKRSEL